MRKIPPALIRAAGIVTIVGGIACAVPLRADPIDTPAPRTYASSTHERKMEHKSEEMAEHVEDRIKSLHRKRNGVMSHRLCVTMKQRSACLFNSVTKIRPQ